ncbi:MAG: type II toxin-antitoxin system VapC family toxin [Treponema sp.]|jgi:predicted nucleic acid-binding protein|nr:type II toxin-antitoxin system VapC family toxin [Treponema sp.]
METKLNYLLDTCILIDYLRGNQGVYDILVNDNTIKLSMSTITLMELVIGALNNREVNYIIKAFKKIAIIYINEEISKLAQDLIIRYSKSHNLHINDALIAATALRNDMELITHNVSDFQYIPNVVLHKI